MYHFEQCHIHTELKHPTAMGYFHRERISVALRGLLMYESLLSPAGWHNLAKLHKPCVDRSQKIYTRLAKRYWHEPGRRTQKQEPNSETTDGFMLARTANSTLSKQGLNPQSTRCRMK